MTIPEQMMYQASQRRPWCAMMQAAQTVTIALDAFLERGEADPRFVDQDAVAEMTGVDSI